MDRVANRALPPAIACVHIYRNELYTTSEREYRSAGSHAYKYRCIKFICLADRALLSVLYLGVDSIFKSKTVAHGPHLKLLNETFDALGRVMYRHKCFASLRYVFSLDTVPSLSWPLIVLTLPSLMVVKLDV